MSIVYNEQHGRESQGWKEKVCIIHEWPIWNTTQYDHNISLALSNEGFSYITQELVKGTSNCLAKFLKNIETDSQFFLNFLYHIRGILPEININLPCSYPPGASQTWWNLIIGFYGKHLTFLSD